MIYSSLVLALVVIYYFIVVLPPKLLANRVEAENALTYQTAVDLMKQTNWYESEKTLNILLSQKYKDSLVLWNYSHARNNSRSNPWKAFNVMENGIPKDYSGEFANDIKTLRDELENNTTVIQEKKSLASSAMANATAAATAANTPSKPKIGMTANELLVSSWGKPTKMNRTTTAYGESYQWVYSSNRYVYLKDDIVTAIQD